VYADGDLLAPEFLEVCEAQVSLLEHALDVPTSVTVRALRSCSHPPSRCHPPLLRLSPPGASVLDRALLRSEWSICRLRAWLCAVGT
jgi:hypothetical protein